MMAFTTDTKQCRTCGEDKTLDAFSAHPSTRDRLQTQCKACAVEYVRNYRKTNTAYRTRSQGQSAAYRRAATKLRQNHQVEFESLYADELTAMGLS